MFPGKYIHRRFFLILLYAYVETKAIQLHNACVWSAPKQGSLSDDWSSSDEEEVPQAVVTKATLSPAKSMTVASIAKSFDLGITTSRVDSTDHSGQPDIRYVV